MEEREIRFVTPAFGNSYLGFLLVTLYSIWRSHPTSRITVLWQDMDPDSVALLMRAFSEAEFVQTSFDIEHDPARRVALKPLFWRIAVDRYPDERLCLIDSDTLVVRDIKHFFAQDFDLVFTYKDEQYPINAGVMLARNRYPQRMQRLMQRWADRTMEVFGDSRLFRIANSADHPYGAADQLAWNEILGYRREQTTYTISLLEGPLSVIGVPCRQLNETNSVPLASHQHVIHYKGGWRPILAHAANFPPHRSREACREMYHLFLRTYLDAVSYLARFEGSRRHGDLGIMVPPYMSIPDLRESEIRYAVHYGINIAKINWERARRFGFRVARLLAGARR